MGRSRVQVRIADRRNSAAAAHSRRRVRTSWRSGGSFSTPFSIGRFAVGSEFPVQVDDWRDKNPRTSARDCIAFTYRWIMGERATHGAHAKRAAFAALRTVSRSKQREGRWRLTRGHECAQRNARTTFRLRAENRQTRISTIVGPRNLPSAFFATGRRCLRIENRPAISIRSRVNGRPGDLRDSCSIVQCR